MAEKDAVDRTCRLPRRCVAKASSMQRGAMFHRETEGRRSRRRKSKKKRKKKRKEEVALARRGVTVAYVNHIEAYTI